MNKQELDRILSAHAIWLKNDGKTGELANLCNADLSGADLSNADLHYANLSGAKLSGAQGPFITFSIFSHHAVFTKSHGHIGCVRLTLDEWLENYRMIGDKHYFSGIQIERYGTLIKLAVQWIREAS